jgi:hypothetical protein
MRKFKVVLFSFLCVAIVSVFTFEVFAAVLLNVKLTGSVEYAATEIGARIWGTYAKNENEAVGESSYLTLKNAGGVP